MWLVRLQGSRDWEWCCRYHVPQLGQNSLLWGRNWRYGSWFILHQNGVWFIFFTPHHLDLGSIFSCEQCCHFFYRLLNGAFFFFPWNRGACRKYGIVVIWRFIRALLCLRAVNRVQANCLVQCSPSSLLPPRPSCYNPFSWSASVSEIPALLSKFKAVI